MSYIKTKAFKDIDKEAEHSIVLRAGGNSLSTYSHAIVLLERSEPKAELLPKDITCEDKRSNRLLNFRVRVDLGTMLVSNVRVSITIPSLERTVTETNFSSSIYEESFSDTATNLTESPKITVTITGLTENNVEKTFTQELLFNIATDCPVPEEPTCYSNSSQFVFRGSIIHFPVKVLIQDKQVVELNTLEEVVQYLNDNNIAMNFYSILMEPT